MRTRLHGFDAVLLAVLIATTLVAFAPAIHCQFNFDDDLVIANQPHVNTGLTAANFRWAMTTWDLGYPIPVTLVSFMLDVSVFGLSPLAFHAENVAWHVANVALLYLLFRRLTGASWRSALVTVLFAVHPLRAESVAWVTERKDMLAAFFGLLAMHAYVSYCRDPRIVRYLPIPILFTVSLFSKPMLVMLPILLVGLDYWPLRRFIPLSLYPGGGQGWGLFYDPPGNQKTQTTLPKVLLEKIPLALISVCCILIGIPAQAQRKLAVEILPLSSTLANGFVSYLRYPGKMLWFRNLAIFYPRVPHWPAWCIPSAILILIAMTAFVLRHAKSRPWLAVGWLWYVVILFPMAGFYVVGDFSIADRYTYFPMIGLLIMLVWSLPDRIARAPWRIPAAAMFGAMMFGLIAATRSQVHTWHDNITLFRHAIAAAGPSGPVCDHLALAFLYDHRYADAISVYQRSLQLNPQNAHAEANLAAAFDAVGERSAAMAHYRNSLELDPANPKVPYNLGTDLLLDGQPKEAIPFLTRAAALEPNSRETSGNLAAALLRSGDAQAAIDECQKVLDRDPSANGVRETLASALALSGQRSAAEVQYELLILRQPQSSGPYNELGSLYLADHKIPTAINYFREALRRDPNLAAAHNNLGVALIQSGNAKEAAAEFQKAVELDPKNENARKNLELGRQLLNK